MNKVLLGLLLGGALGVLVTGYVTARYGKGGPAGNPQGRPA